MKAALLSLLALLATAVAGGAAFIASGAYDISANVQHTQPVYSLLELTMHRSVKRRAASVEVPALNGAGLVERGGLCFRDKCLQCHGGPGVAQAEIGRSMQPLPGPLVDAAARWRSAELYWITRNGIKMSGMPAWQHRLSDDDLWALVAFMERLPMLTRATFGALAGPQIPGHCEAPVSAAARPVDTERGRVALTQYACNACHSIPGITGADVHVGPPLAGIASRGLIAGRLPNNPESLQRWLRDPTSVDPHTTMPDMQVGESDARDIAAYLATLR
ncbi:MAG: c-type cytochrome [Pseudomonadota bacterium]